MFVERITKDQMKMFLETFACCSEQKNLVMRLNYAGKEPYLDVTRFSNGLVYTDSYYDFDSTYCSNLWNKFLYTQFTHEYYTAFKEYLMKDVDRKLTNMIKIWKKLLTLYSIDGIILFVGDEHRSRHHINMRECWNWQTG